MDPHGEYTISVDNNIVHVYPVGGFNAQGIIDLRKSIYSAAPKHQPWILFEHPLNLAGLTPDAIESIILSYQSFSKINCLAIALEVSTTWHSVFRSEIVGHVDIPVLLGDNLADLNVQLNEILQSS